MSVPILTPEITVVLNRYLEIQAEEKRLQEEKKRLQTTLAIHLGQIGLESWNPEFEGKKVMVRISRRDSIQYDEDLLRSRLGPRFPAILAPDQKKVERNEQKVNQLLAPIIEIVGSVSREKVRNAIGQGIVRPEEFDGAFSKKKWTVTSVTRIN